MSTFIIQLSTWIDATCETVKTCEVCGACYGEKKPHTITDGKCTVCGNTPNSGEHIYFGSYPQSKVIEESLISTLNSLAGTLPTSSNSRSWTSYGYYKSGSVQNYMWYIDIASGGEKYRGVYFTSYRPYWCGSSSSSGNSYQPDNGYYTENVYWFKFEPISWTILNESDGNALILCDMIIDSQQYDYDGSYSNNYKESTIRAWLNDNFYNTAFSALQQSIILTTEVDNSVSSTGYSSNSYACANTNDKVFLLSYKEATTYITSDTARQRKTTDYAQAQGAYTSTYSDYSGNGWWWLRSPAIPTIATRAESTVSAASATTSASTTLISASSQLCKFGSDRTNVLKQM